MVFEIVKYSLRFKILVADLDVSMCKMCLRYIQICDKSYGTEGVLSYGRTMEMVPLKNVQ
jgi:hypothetical protein